MASHVKRVRAPDLGRASRAIADFLEAAGYETAEEPLAGTPERVARAYLEELLDGEGAELKELIHAGAEPLGSPVDAVLVRGVQVVTVCPHHLFLAEGQAEVGYEPGTLLLGLGTLTRLVSAVTNRLTFQEHIARDVASALMDHAGARGAYCRLELRHGCLRCRGPKERGAEVASVHAQGTLADPARIALLRGQAG